MNPNL